MTQDNGLGTPRHVHRPGVHSPARLFALIGSHSATVRQQASAERLQTSMSQLSTWTGKAKTTIKQADQIRLKDTDDTDSLRRLIDSNGRLMHSDRTGLSENESERLAAKPTRPRNAPAR